MRMSVHLVGLSAPRHLLSVLLTCSKSIRKTNKMSKKRSWEPASYRVSPSAIVFVSFFACGFEMQSSWAKRWGAQNSSERRDFLMGSLQSEMKEEGIASGISLSTCTMSKQCVALTHLGAFFSVRQTDRETIYFGLETSLTSTFTRFLLAHSNDTV